jgi:uncharacterized membrane protein SirB2
MAEFYAEIRLVHIAAVLASGALFFVRGIVLAWGARKLTALLRYLSFAIDTVLLTAGVMLTTIVRQYPFVDAWLTTKVLLLVLYVALGLIAFRSGRTPAIRVGSCVAALVVYGFIISVAHAHNPLGIFAGFS